ncbi:unnamed protein product [Dibothriocephalus latus]|uniref:Uncharacterized protein n=1 Tax=Dibothriocephalus latus TaxID=60516 RepID=A0A3P7LU50_DIBLA|nr:unnamed protein product [Dibothriocephalus latus]
MPFGIPKELHNKKGVKLEATRRRILMDFQELSDEFSYEPTAGEAATAPSQPGTSNVQWNQRLLDELRFAQTSHEDYFSGEYRVSTS